MKVAVSVAVCFSEADAQARAFLAALAAASSSAFFLSIAADLSSDYLTLSAFSAFIYC